MKKGLMLWVIWLLALATGIYGTALVYEGSIGRHPIDLIYGIPILLLGIWVTGNVLASAKQSYRKNKKRTTRA